MTRRASANVLTLYEAKLWVDRFKSVTLRQTDDIVQTVRRAVINRACQFWQLQKRTAVLTFIPSSIIVSSGWSSCLRATCTSDVSLKVTSSVVEHIYLSSLMCLVCNDRWTRGPRNNILIIVGLTDSSKGSKSRRRFARCFNPYSKPFLITIFKKYFYGKRDLSWLPKPYYNAPVFKSGNLQDNTNYRPIAFQPVFENEFENLIGTWKDTASIK